MAEHPLEDWETATIEALGALEAADLATVEILLIDELAAWVFSSDNPGLEHLEPDYSEEQGGAVVSALLSALVNGVSGVNPTVFRPLSVPAASPEIDAIRERIVSGAHELSRVDHGLALLIARLMHAAIAELKDKAGDPVQQLIWTYVYALLAVACGQDGVPDEPSMRALISSFNAWDRHMAEGFRLPWRQNEPSD